MDIAKLIEQINLNSTEQVRLNLETFDYASKEAETLIDLLNAKQTSAASLHWEDSMSSKSICDYFLNFLRNTKIRKIQLFVPQEMEREDVDALKFALETIKATDTTFKITYHKRLINGEPAECVLKDLIAKSNKNELDTDTIVIPTNFAYLTEGYNEVNFSRELEELLITNKFKRIVFEWFENSEDPTVDESVNELLIDVVDFALTHSNMVTEFEIDMTVSDSCPQHVKFAKAYAENAQAMLDGFEDQKRIFFVNPPLNAHRLRLFSREEKAGERWQKSMRQRVSRMRQRVSRDNDSAITRTSNDACSSSSSSSSSSASTSADVNMSSNLSSSSSTSLTKSPTNRLRRKSN